MAGRDCYSYTDCRDFSFTDERERPSFFIFHTTELAHILNADLSRSAIVLYLYIGTHVSGRQRGFAIGGRRLQTRLGLNRSTLYKALKQLEAAGLLVRRSEPNETPTRLGLAQVHGEPWPTPERIAQIRAGRRARRAGPSTQVDTESTEVSPQGDKDSRPRETIVFDKEEVSSRGAPSGSTPQGSEQVTMERCRVPLEPLPYKVPNAVTDGVWNLLMQLSETDERGHGLFSLARDGDSRLFSSVLAMLEQQPMTSEGRMLDLPASNGQLYRQWIFAAMTQAGKRGDNPD